MLAGPQRKKRTGVASSTQVAITSQQMISQSAEYIGHDDKYEVHVNHTVRIF